MFLDEANINIKAGNGGDGSVSFFYPKGKRKKISSGGRGGKGGDIILKATRSLNELSKFKRKIHFKAEDGGRGLSNNKTGKDGKDLTITVPVGTLIKDENGKILADLDREGKKFAAAKGGIGGRGNASFVSQTRRFPSFAEKGEKVKENWINLELRLIADIALVGFPNVGKSTIISRISSAKPKIADYPFTTLVPNLGVVFIGNDSFVVADIPGLIENAHRGAGLGDKFLRHITRALIMVMVLDGKDIINGSENDNILKNFNILRKELKLYDKNLYKKDFVIAINKIDLVYDRENLKRKKENLEKITRKEVVPISALTGEGLDKLVFCLSKKIKEKRKELKEKEVKTLEEKVKVYSINGERLDDEKIEISKEGDSYIVKSKKLERIVSMTDIENEEALDYLKYRLKKMGIGDKLKKMGVEEGSSVTIGGLVFELKE